MGTGGSVAAGKNGARVTYELILVTNEYTEHGDRTRGELRMESGRATLAWLKCGGADGARELRADVRRSKVGERGCRADGRRAKGRGAGADARVTPGFPAASTPHRGI